MASDDLSLVATYYPVETNAGPAVILLHSYGKKRDEWNDIAPLLQRNGIAALAIDLRGHGESTRRLTADGPQLVDVHNFQPRDFQDMLLDINIAFDWLVQQPGIDKHHIAIVGSDLGANLALRYGAFNEDIVAFVLVSPSIINHNVRADDVIGKIGKRPLRIVIARDDAFVFESTNHLLELRKQAGQSLGDDELIVTTGYLHGTPLLTGVKGLTAQVFGWLQQILQSAPPAP